MWKQLFGTAGHLSHNLTGYLLGTTDPTDQMLEHRRSNSSNE